MKKKIRVIVILLVLLILSIAYLVYINTHKAQGDYDFTRIDVVFEERLNAKNGEIITDYETDYIIEKDTKEKSENEKNKVSLVTKNEGDVIYISVIPDGNENVCYNILKEKDSGYGIFSYVLDNFEIYRVYVRHENIVGVKDTKNSKLYKDTTYIEEKELLEVQKLYKYYIELVISGNINK